MRKNACSAIEEACVLIVDDEPSMLSSIRRSLNNESYKRIFAGSGKEALDILGKTHIDIIVSDLRMPGMGGMELLRIVKQKYPEIIRIILSAARDTDQTIEAINTGEVYRFLSKPILPEPLQISLKEIVDYHQMIKEREEMIKEIDRRLLQASPPFSFDGATTSSLMISAQNLDGDFSDLFPYDKSHFDLLIGDVMGKGIQSALVAAGIKNNFARFLPVNEFNCESGNSKLFSQSPEMKGIENVMSKVHSLCIDDLLKLEMFSTLIFARFDLLQGVIGIVDCGHLPVLHYREESNDCVLLSGKNTPLGMIKNQTYQSVTADIKPGDTLLFYSDGVTETMSKSGELYGEDRLIQIFKENHGLSSNALVESIRKDASDFRGSDVFQDDFTCTAVSINRNEK